MNKQEYYKLLKWHDWFYNMTDDHRAYLVGQSEADKLRAISKGNPELTAMYHEYQDAIFTGKPIPEEPKD